MAPHRPALFGAPRRTRLSQGAVALRPLRRRDTPGLARLRQANRQWLDRWEATAPPGLPGGPTSLAESYARWRADARQGRAIHWVVEYEGEMVGQIMITSIAMGAACTASLGYWLSESKAGRGITPLAAALAVDHAMGAAQLHRIEAAVQPGNAASLRVLAKLGFRDEGVRRAFLRIGGQWSDYRIFAITAEEIPDGLVARLRAVGQVPG